MYHRGQALYHVPFYCGLVAKSEKFLTDTMFFRCYLQKNMIIY